MPSTNDSPAGKAEHDAAKQAAHQQARADIAQTETDARARQTQAQFAARGEVTTARIDWQHEIDQVDSDLHTQAAGARDQPSAAGGRNQTCAGYPRRS